MDKYVGKKLEGRYQILELIGFGGMAMVYKAYDILEQRNVAVKILKDEYLENEDFKRRFRNESKAIAVLSHPNIVKIYDVNFSDNIQYIVMEYVDGITLKEYIEQQKVVNWKETIHFTIQILKALQHAHDAGIVHRDVKPQNVMLLEDGTIKVMDFGIARFARENGKTLSEKAIGSVHYISPEQARGETTDEKTDVYAVGVMMYEMLTGQVPFDGDSPVSIAIKQMQSEAVMPREINPDIPYGLEEIIVRAMKKDPELRYPTASEMLKDIEEFKLNPDVVFEYKYFNEDGSTQYFTKIDKDMAIAQTNVMAAAGGKKSDEKGKQDGKDGKDGKKKSYTINILAGVAAACVLLAGLALFFFFKSINSKTTDVILPSFVGMTVEEAQKAAPKVKIVVTAREESTEYEEGKIISQNPDANIKVKVDSEVQVVVSAGLSDIKMPDLTKKSVSEAKTELEKLGVTNIELVNKFNSTVESGLVISTDPVASSPLTKDSKVIIYVSIGDADVPVRVPNLKGMTESQAKDALQKAGLNVGKIETVSSSEAAGTVVGQSLSANASAQKGTTVDLQISDGKGSSSETTSSTTETVKLTVPLKFPDKAINENIYISVYINGQFADKIQLNPSKTKSHSFDFTLKGGKINNSFAATSNNVVKFVINSKDYAEYGLDFSGKNVNEIKAPDYSILKPSDSSSSSSSNTSSEETRENG